MADKQDKKTSAIAEIVAQYCTSRIVASNSGLGLVMT